MAVDVCILGCMSSAHCEAWGGGGDCNMGGDVKLWYHAAMHRGKEP